MKLGILDAVLWVLGAIAGLLVAVPIVVWLAPGANSDLVTLGAVQSAVYLSACAWFAARRPGRSFSALFALRKTSLWLVILAVLLGVLLYLPAASLAGFVDQLFPLDAAERARREAQLVPRSVLHGIALFVVVVGFGVFAEELLFRGALYTGLRPRHSAASAVASTSLLFTITHAEPRFWPSILGISFVLGTVRALGGSLWPALFLHAAFNATALAMTHSGSGFEEPSATFVAASTLGSLGVFYLFSRIGKASAFAGRAREADLENDEGLSEARP